MKGYLLSGPVPPFQGGDVWLTCHLGLGAVRLTPGYHIPGFQPADVAPIRGVACLTAVRELGICLPWGSARAAPFKAYTSCVTATANLTAPEYQYEANDHWARLPPGWGWTEVAAVAADSQDRVYVFNRGEHPVMIFDRQGT